MIAPPRRIISLVPSQTELLFDLGLDEEVIGITKFCIYPGHWFKSKQRIGGTKQLNLPLIQSLLPDLVIANKEENVKEQVDAIEQFCPVYCSDISTLAESYYMIDKIGKLTNTSSKASLLIESIKNEFSNLQTTARPIIKVAYLIWRNPYMTIGADTFINDMLRLAGFENVFDNRNRYPQISLEELAVAGADLILFSSEPFPFKEKHLMEIRTCWSQNNVQPLPLLKIVNGEMFSWYGSRLLHSANYFRKLRESLFLNDE